ncbi:MAG: MFS transporter [Micromonosporaceae bacterium]
MTDKYLLRRFIAFVVAHGASACGNFLNLIALNLYAYHLTDSAVQTGLLMALRLSVGFLAGPLAGRLATRHNRRAVMIISDVSQATAMLTLAVLPAVTHLPLLYVAAIVMGAGNTVFVVALRSSVPEMVGPEHRVRANSYLVTGKSLGMVLGFASAGVVVGWLGFDAAFLINAATFVISASVLGWLPLRFRAAAYDATSGADDQPLRALRLLLVSYPVLLAMLALRSLDAFGSASHNVGLPIFADIANPSNPAAFLSQFWVCWAVGTLTASQLMPRWAARSGRNLGERAFAVAVSVMSAGFIAVFLELPWFLMMLAAVIAGLADGASEIIYTSRLQTLEDHQRGAVFGLSTTTETLGFATGMLAVSVLLEAWPVLAVVALFHGVALLGVAAFLALLVVRRRAAAATEPEAAVEPAEP